MPGDHSADVTIVDPFQQLLVGGTGHPAVGTDVVVDQSSLDGHAKSACEGSALDFLALHPGGLTGGVVADAAVDDGVHGGLLVLWTSQRPQHRRRLTSKAMADAKMSWLSTKAAAAYLGIAPRTLYRLIDDGRLAAYKFGRVIRLKQQDVDAYIESARLEPGSLRHLYPDGRVDDDTADEPGPGDTTKTPDDETP